MHFGHLCRLGVQEKKEESRVVAFFVGAICETNLLLLFLMEIHVIYLSVPVLYLICVNKKEI